jgi:hypothetical protein
VGASGAPPAIAVISIGVAAFIHATVYGINKAVEEIAETEYVSELLDQL